MPSVAQAESVTAVRQSVERATLGDRLYLAPHLTRTAELQEVGYKFRSAVGSLKRCYPKTKVHVGTEYGRAWIDEVAESEGVESGWKDNPRTGVLPFMLFSG